MKGLLVMFLAAVSLTATAQKHPVERTWYNAEKSAKIRIYKAVDGRYYGKIVWLQIPDDPDGKPRTDKLNPDQSRRSRPLMDMPILTGFSLTNDHHVLEGGKVYDPKNGKTYCGKLSLNGNVLDLRGFICGMSFLGRNAQWTLAE